jgi:hypothetical protein
VRAGGLIQDFAKKCYCFFAVSQEVQVAHSFLALLASHVLQLEQEARERDAAARARVRKRVMKGKELVGEVKRKRAWDRPRPQELTCRTLCPCPPLVVVGFASWKRRR